MGTLRRLALIAILLAPLAGAAIDVDPKQVGSATVLMDLRWDITFASQAPSEATFSTFGFMDTGSQRVEYAYSDHVYSNLTDSLGNRKFEFTFNPSSQQESIRLQSRIKVDSMAPRPAAVGDLSRYLKASPFVQLDPQIASHAAELSYGATNDLERAVRLTEWVNSYVTYDGAGYGDSIQNSSWVYANRRGTCDEFSHLLIAMLRSVNIPARFVAGLVYTGETWGMHAWVEAAIDGEWVALDPTYGEAGRIDATHAVFSYGVDQDDIKSEIRARSNGLSGASLDGTAITPVPSVQILSRGNFSQDRFTMSVSVPSGRVGEGSLENVSVVVSGAKEPTGVSLSISAPRELSVLNGANRLVYLAPGQTRSASWRVLVPADLNEGYVYRYPITVASLGAAQTGILEAQRGMASRQGEGLAVTEMHSRLDGTDVVFSVSLRNEGNLPIADGNATLMVGGLTRQARFDLGVGASDTIELRFPNAFSQAEVSGVLYLNGTHVSLRRPITVLLSTPTPTEPPVAFPSGRLVPDVPEIPSVGGENVVVYGALAVVLLGLVGWAVWRR